MTSIFTMRFGKSASENYAKAIKLAREFNTFKEVTDSHPYNEIVVSTDELISKTDALNSLIRLVLHWRSTNFLYNEQFISLPDVFTIQRILECRRKRKQAVIQKTYCYLDNEKEGWGCKLLTTINRYADGFYCYKEEQKWFEFGKFIADNVWEIDKKEIEAALEREIKIKKVELCDVFEIDRIKSILRDLPDRIDLDENPKWVVRCESVDTGVEIQQKKVGIEPKRDSESTDTDDIQGEEATLKEKRNIPIVTFKDIGGIDDMIQTVREVIELPIKRPELFAHLGIKSHRGILLYGLPGCGKTMIAKAIANEIKAHFISIRGPELLSKYVGQSEANLREVFEEAKQLQPSIIYFDEIDAVGQSRSGEESVRYLDVFLNQLLTLMDGIEDYGNICVMASTNRLELLDPALLRPGRFDYHLEIRPPTHEGCLQIFRIVTRKMPIPKDFDVCRFAERLFGLTGADIAFIARESAYNCIRQTGAAERVIELDDMPSLPDLEITQEDFDLALKSVVNKSI